MEKSSIVTCTHSGLDLIRQTDVEMFFQNKKPEYVFLAAAKVGGILANNTYKADFIYENIMIAANVINAAYKYGVKKCSISVLPVFTILNLRHNQ